LGGWGAEGSTPLPLPAIEDPSTEVSRQTRRKKENQGKKVYGCAVVGKVSDYLSTLFSPTPAVSWWKSLTIGGKGGKKKNKNETKRKTTITVFVV